MKSKKTKKWPWFAAFAVFAIIALLCVIFLSTREEFTYAEPDLMDLGRAGRAIQKVFASAMRSEDPRDMAELKLSPEDVDSLLLVLQSRQNPWLTRKFGEKPPFQVRRKGALFEVEYVYPLPGGAVNTRFVCEFLPVLADSSISVTLAAANWGACPLPRETLERRIASLIAAHQSELAPYLKAVALWEIGGDGSWRILYRPYQVRMLLQNGVR